MAKKIQLPKACIDCEFIGKYIIGQGQDYRLPQYFCELTWIIKEIDYNVKPDTLARKCPLKSKKITKIIKNINEKESNKEEK